MKYTALLYCRLVDKNTGVGNVAPARRDMGAILVSFLVRRIYYRYIITLDYTIYKYSE